MGITVCIAAGNSCFNLDDVTNPLPDSGCTVVGASFPGAPHCRIPFSNFDKGGRNAGSNTVHVSAWGMCVASTGFSGNLRLPGGDVNRSYCSDFNGTSAA